MTKIFSHKYQTDIRKRLRNHMTKSETVLWKHIKGNQLGFKFRRQCGIGKYIVDFYCPKLKLVVEVDGLTHYEEEILEKDLKKEEYFKSLGLHVKRYSATQIFKLTGDILQDLYNTCQELTTPPLRGTPPSQGGDSNVGGRN